MRKSTATAIACGLVVLALAALLYSRRSSASDGEARTKQVAREGAKAFAKVAVQSFTDREAVADSLAQATVAHEETLNNPASAEALRTAVTEFLIHRFGSEGPEDYVRWREQNGYEWQSKDLMLFPGIVDWGHEFLFDEDLPADWTVPEMFKKFWAGSESFSSRRSAVRALARESDGLVISFGTTEAMRPGFPSVATSIPMELWHGRIARMGRRWWKNPEELDDLLERYERVNVAAVGIIFEYENGSRQPIIMQWYENPSDRRWHINALSINNFLEDGVLCGFEY